MHLTHLSLTNFRAFTRLDMDVPRQILLLVGENAQGKTTLLEAIYFLATFTSFHAHSDRELISFMAGNEPLAVTRLVADYMRGGHAHRTEARLILETGQNGSSKMRKEILLDGVKKPLQEALGHFNAVIFLPQMIHIFEGGPDERRRYLNLTISQVVPGYVRALNEYNQALTQRNALLKLLFERNGDVEQLGFWDAILADRGAAIIQARINALEELESSAARVHQRLTRTNEVLRLAYRPSYDPVSAPAGQYNLPLNVPVQRDGIGLNEIRKGFAGRLQELRREEISRGVTTIGPHRDDFVFYANGINLGDFGSRGQQRTALLALKLAEVQWMKEKTGDWPVLLLDETMAELDIKRRSDLLHTLSQSEQGLLTTTDLNYFSKEFISANTVWQVSEGQVTPRPELASGLAGTDNV